MYISRPFCLFLVLLSSAPLMGFAQIKFHCTVYLNTGESIKGYCNNFKEWMYNPAFISFSPESGSDTVMYYPNDCSGFVIDGYDEYKSYEITRTLNQVHIFNTSTEAALTQRTEQIRCFLRVLATAGEKQLLEYSDVVRPNYYITGKGGNSPAELLYYVYYGTNDQMVKLTTYKDQLEQFFANDIETNASMKHEIANLNYDEKSLTGLFKSINKSNGYAGVSKQERYPGELILFGGIALNNLKATETIDYVPQTKINYATPVSPVLSLGYMVYSQRSFGRNFLMPSITYSSSNSTGNITDGRNYYEQALTTQMLSLDLHAGRNLVQNDNLKWYATVFLSGGFFVKNRTESKHETYTFYDTIYTNKSINGTSNYFVFGTQTGLVFKKKFGIWAKYHTGIVLSSFKAYNYSLHQLQIGGELRFNKR